MGLSNKHRDEICRGLGPIIGEEATEAMLSEFPARELDEPATKEFVRAEVSALEARISERFREMTIWVAGAVMAGMGLAAAIGTALGAALG